MQLRFRLNLAIYTNLPCILTIQFDVDMFMVGITAFPGQALVPVLPISSKMNNGWKPNKSPSIEFVYKRVLIEKNIVSYLMLTI